MRAPESVYVPSRILGDDGGPIPFEILGIVQVRLDHAMKTVTNKSLCTLEYCNNGKEEKLPINPPLVSQCYDSKILAGECIYKPPAHHRDPDERDGPTEEVLAFSRPSL